MQNPLFTGLVSYALNSAESSASEHFQPRLLHLLKDLKMAEDWEELPWYPTIKQSWSQVPSEVFVDLLADFKHVMGQAELNQLMSFGAAIRIELIITNSPPLAYKVVNIFATYTVQWADGQQVEYNCRPYGLEAGGIDIAQAAKLSRMFSERFIEAAAERPGLDAYYTEVAKPFNQEAFLELMHHLHGHIEKMPIEQQEDYQHVLTRLNHQFGPPPELQSPGGDTPLEPTNGGGGFN
jgi:hypothetical protein